MHVSSCNKGVFESDSVELCHERMHNFVDHFF